MGTASKATLDSALRTAAEVKRVLKPGGRFIFVEHVRSSLLRVRLVQGVLDPITVRLEGDHYTREPLEHLMREGFEIEEKQRYGVGIVERVVAMKREAAS